MFTFSTSLGAKIFLFVNLPPLHRTPKVGYT